MVKAPQNVKNKKDVKSVYFHVIPYIHTAVKNFFFTYKWPS